MAIASKERVHDLWGKFPKMGPPARTTPDIILLSPRGSVSLDLLWSIPRGMQIPLGGLPGQVFSCTGTQQRVGAMLS